MNRKGRRAAAVKAQPATATKVKANPAVLPVHGTDAAPFIVFDRATCYGVVGGMVAVELAAVCMIPADPRPLNRQVITAHIRCSIAAAMNLHATIQAALSDEQARIKAEMLKQQAAQRPKPSSYPQVNDLLPPEVDDDAELPEPTTDAA